jgi:hypothetical protein
MNGSGERTLLAPPPVNAAKEGVPTEADAMNALASHPSQLSWLFINDLK